MMIKQQQINQLFRNQNPVADSPTFQSPTFEKIFFMRFDRPVPLVEIARLIGARIIGETEGVASGINEIHKVEEGDLAFVDHPKYYRKCIDSAATYIIINQETSFPPHKALLLVDEPFRSVSQDR
jgi:hypothetical protein